MVTERHYQVVERQTEVAERRSGPFRLNLTTDSSPLTVLVLIWMKTTSVHIYEFGFRFLNSSVYSYFITYHAKIK